MAGEKDDAPPPPPRQTYMPKPPSKEEVEQVSREQGMIADDWTGEPSAAEGSPVHSSEIIACSRLTWSTSSFEGGFGM